MPRWTPFYNPWARVIHAWPNQWHSPPIGGIFSPRPPLPPQAHTVFAPIIPSLPQAPVSLPNALAWDQTALVSALNNLSMQALGGSEWYMDSGATTHISSEAGILSSPSPIPSYFPHILVGSGASIPITYTSHTLIPSLHCPLLLNNVLVAPNIVKNLVSV